MNLNFYLRIDFPSGVEIGTKVTNVWRRIYSEWFPSSQFEQVEGPYIEEYYWIGDIHFGSHL